MASTEWYYAHDGQQAGPISALELKQLADAGRLTPDDLVWQEGVKDWIPARKVKGLFDAKQVAAAAPSIAAPPVVAPTAKAADRPPSGINRISVATGDRPIVTAERPSVADRAKAAPRRHPIEAMLAAIARNTGRPFIDAASLLFTQAGHWGLYAAMLASLALGAAFAVKLHDYSLLAVQAGVIPALVILQFVSRRLLDACGRLAHTDGAEIGSTAVLDACALAAMLAGLATVIGMTVVAVETRLVWVALPGLAGFIVLEYLAILAVNPEALDLSVEPEVGLAEEAIGFFSSMVMMLARLAPVLWGVGVLWGAAEIILASVSVFADAASLWPALEWTTPAIALFALVPLWAYLKLLAYHLLVALVRAVLSVPDRNAE